jgi:RNA polymerase sigma-70 factor, ECF subfamily
VIRDATRDRLRASRLRKENRTLDEEGLRAFVHTIYPRLVGTIALVCGSRAAAEDAVQEALARAWERSERGEHIASLPAWVTTASLNLARSGLRRLRAERRAQVRLRAEDAVKQETSVAGDRIDVRRALAALPRRQREATVLRYYLGLDLEELAAAMNVPEGTAKSLLARARSALAAALRVNDIEEVSDRGEA